MVDQNTAPYLEVRFHLADGSTEHFIQETEATARRILDNLRPAQLFKQSRIMLAGTYSMTALVPAHITRIDFASTDFACWDFPAGLSDVVAVPEEMFREQAGLDDPTRLQKRGQSRVAGDAFVAFIDVQMRGGEHVYLMIEGAVDLPAERFQRVQLFLSGANLHARLPEGGMTILNLANLVRFTAYPGPAEAPTDAWTLHHKQTS